MFDRKNSIMNFTPSLFVSIFDLPARAKALNMITHTGYNACINCDIVGAYAHKKVYYPFQKIIKTRDQMTYKSCLKEVFEKNSSINSKFELNISGIKGPSSLSNSLNILKDVAYDYMHLCCEGFMERFIKLILHPPDKKRKLDVSTKYYIGKFKLIIKLKN